jgi:hypothetical protein
MAFFYRLQALFKKGMTMQEVRNILRDMDKEYKEGDVFGPLFGHLGYYDTFLYESSGINDVFEHILDFEFHFYNYLDYLVGFTINFYPNISDFNEQILTLFINENGIPDIITEVDDHVIYHWINAENQINNHFSIIPRERITIDIGKNIYKVLVCRVAFNDPEAPHQEPINGFKLPKGPGWTE